MVMQSKLWREGAPLYQKVAVVATAQTSRLPDGSNASCRLKSLLGVRGASSGLSSPTTAYFRPCPDFGDEPRGSVVSKRGTRLILC